MANFAFQVMAEDIEPVHFAYANYLGSGIYKTTEQNASLISMPFAYDLGQKEKTSFSLRLPISVGFFDFELTDIPSLELPNEVGTVTFTPGVAFKYQYNSAWVIESYADLGYGRNLTTKKGVTISSAGISALYYFNLNEIDSIWASRVYYANYDGNGYETVDSLLYKRELILAYLCNIRY
jgi:glutamine cyclotransferase